LPDRSRCACAALIERLEDRRLLSANLDLHISFQPAGLPLVSGYVADSGALFGDQGNGLSFGWDADNAKNVRLHKTKVAPDLRYNTYAMLLSGHKKGGHAWSISLPNDTYSVHLVVGDGSTGWKSEVDADGVVAVDGKATKKSRWLDNTVTMNVTDGVLTLVNGAKTKKSKLAFIDIQEIGSGSSQTDGGDTTTTGGGTTTTGGDDTTTTGGGGTTTTGGGGATPPALPTLAWTTAAKAPIALAEAQSVAVNGKLYVFGGYSVTTPDYQPTNAAEAFDPAANTWTTLAPMPAAETHMGVASDGQNIYVAGGYTFNPKTTYQTFATANVFKYNIAADSWSTFTALPAARGAGALVYLDGELHFIDGVNTSRVGQTDHWVLSPTDANPQWTDSTPVPFSANHTAAVVLNGKIYIVGGQSTSDDSSTIADVIVWDPANPSVWTAVASMPIRRSHAMVSVADGQIIVAGGTTGADIPLASVLAYNPQTNTWTSQTPLPSARLAPVGGVIGNTIIVATGVGSGQLQSQTWEAAAG
jgi:N-acetylneuraminic acid mutarotase